MDGAQLKQLWRSGQPRPGGWITSTDQAVAAIMCNIGYEWLVIDCEHRMFNPETLRSIILLMLSKGVVPIVRVRANDEAIIKQMLDTGAEGIMVPMIRTAEEARRAVMACRYPPEGVRGFGPREASDFYKNVTDYQATINKRVIVMLIIEHIDAIKNLDEILQVPGVDALVIGPADLTYSMEMSLHAMGGRLHQVDHPSVQEAINTIITKANAACIPVGMSATAEDFQSWLERGIDFLFLGSDYEFIMQAGGSILNLVREATRDR